MDSELFGKVVQREKAVVVVEAFLVLAVAAFHLAVVTRCIGADELVADSQIGGCFLKQGGVVLFAREEAVGEL